MSTPKRPRTPAQQEASRQNGAKSHGPVTEIGKQHSRRNALKHGLCAASVLLPDEDEDECQALIDDYEQHYRPVTHLELARVREMALCDWRLCRTVEMERGLLSLAWVNAEKAYDYQNLDTGEIQAHAFQYSLAGSPALPLLLRYQAHLQRTQERARKALKQLQAEREQQEREQATLPNEPKPVIPIRPEPATPGPPQPSPVTPLNEPEPVIDTAADAQPNEPKLTRQQRRYRERNNRKK